MNLFVVVLGERESPTKSRRDGEIEAVLRSVASAFPSLNDGEFRSITSRDVRVATLSHGAPSRTARRVYHHEADHLWLTYDGAVVDGRGEMNAHDAASLAQVAEGDLAVRLEGRFALIRLDPSTAQVSLLTDPIGKYPLFVYEGDRYSVLSNSARAIAIVGGLRQLDVRALAHAAGYGWVGGDVSSVRGVTLLSGGGAYRRDGTRWVAAGPRFSPTAPLDVDVDAAATDVEKLVATHFRYFPSTRCPITAGRDSRLLAALCEEAKLRPTYFTRGDPSDIDVQLGSEIARKMGWRHEVVRESVSDLSDADWERDVDLLVTQTDGMVSLWQAADVRSQRDPFHELSYTLGGIGGEVARRFYDKKEWRGDVTLEGAIEALTRRLTLAGNPLLSPEGRDIVERHLRGRLAELHEQHAGRVEELADLFYLYERVTRWGGANARKVASRGDTLAPLCSRPFLRASFGLDVKSRRGERLHVDWVRRASPTLYSMPLDVGEWPRLGTSLPNRLAAQSMRWKIARVLKRSGEMNRRRVVSAQIGRIRRDLLDSNDASIWSVLDRASLESLTSSWNLPNTHLRTLQQIAAVAALVRYGARLRDDPTP